MPIYFIADYLGQPFHIRFREPISFIDIGTTNGAKFLAILEI